MDHRSQGNNANPYSPLLCILLLLGTGVAVKVGAAVHQGSSYLALNW
jgi:hypothetical protein